MSFGTASQRSPGTCVKFLAEEYKFEVFYGLIPENMPWYRRYS